MSLSSSKSNMPRSTAEALKQIQKQGLSISIIGGDSPKPGAVETGPKEIRVKQIPVVSETLPNISRMTSSSENKPTFSQVRQISNASIENNRSTSQSAFTVNQTSQTGINNKLSPVSSEMKLQPSQKLSNSNPMESKSQLSALNRSTQIEKNQTSVARHPQSAFLSDGKLQGNRLLSFSGALDVKSNRNNTAEAKIPVVHTRSQNQNATADIKANTNQSRLAVASPPLENKTNSNQGRVVNQNSLAAVIDKSGQRNQLSVSEIKAPNQCKIIPIKQSDIKTVGPSKSHQTVKVVTQSRAISQLQPAPRVSRSSNNNNVSENSCDSPHLPGVNMPKVAVKRVAVATSTPVLVNKRKCVKVTPPNVAEQSESQSDVTLSSDESPVKDKKAFNLRSITPGLTITPVQTANPSTSTSAKKPVESNKNIIVICPSCKQCSYNMTQCDSCHEVFTTTPVRYQLKSAPADSPASIVVTQNVTTSIEKSMKIVYHVSPNQNFKFQKTQQVIKVSPRRGRPKRRYIEPVCYTLSSDDDEALPYEPIPGDINGQIVYSPDLEGNHESEHSSNSDMMPEDNPDFEEPHYPGVTRIKDQQFVKHGLNHSMDDDDEEEEEEEEAEDEELEHEMEMEEEMIEEDPGVELPEFDEEDEELEEEEEEEEDILPDEEEKFMPQFNRMLSNTVPKKIDLKVRSIRIGSYKIHPDQNMPTLYVTLTEKSIHFNAPRYNDATKEFIPIVLNAHDVESMQIHFGKCLPIIFVRTTENFGNYVKRTLNMPKSVIELFIPKSDDLKRNKLTFLIDQLTDEQRTFMRQIFPGPEKLKELDQKEANEILVKSTPNVREDTNSTVLSNLVKINVQDAQISSSPSPSVAVTQSVAVTSPHVITGLPPGLTSQALSITKVTVKPTPPAPVVKILTYPPPPQTGGIAINTADFATLEEGEFLNDAILDFYLKYVFYEKLSQRDREKTHIFSSFFYPRLTQKPDRLRPGDDVPKTMQMRRHNQVKTWTKHVDIFSKDYIVIPVNQHNHWFLAIVCYPGHVPETVEKVEPKTAKATDIVTSSSDHVTNKVIIKEETSISEDNQADTVNNDSSYEVEEPPDSDEEESPELPEKSNSSNVTYCEGGKRKETPCILIFDSLSGPNRWRIASTLREYLEMEWKIRKGTKKAFDKNTMQGFIVKCPQQTNFSDCGLYVLQYVESFFQNPIPYFGHPMPDLTNWFSDPKISKKRQEIKELILNLQKKYANKVTSLSGVTIKKVIQPSVSSSVTSTQSDNR